MKQKFIFSEQESFYQKLHELLGNKEGLEDFLSGLDKKWIEEKKLVVPKIRENIPVLFEEDELFLKSEVAINRHWRYEPEFTHEHEFFEMMYVYEGQVTHKVEGNSCVLNTGDCCILPPGVKHSLWTENAIIFNSWC